MKAKALANKKRNFQVHNRKQKSPQINKTNIFHICNGIFYRRLRGFLVITCKQLVQNLELYFLGL